jgi:hypothetical protein
MLLLEFYLTVVVANFYEVFCPSSEEKQDHYFLLHS